MNEIRIMGASKRNWWVVPALLAGTAIALTARAVKRAHTPYVYK